MESVRIRCAYELNNSVVRVVSYNVCVHVTLYFRQTIIKL